MLKNKIELLLEGHSLNVLAKAREKLTNAYRMREEKKVVKTLDSDHQRLAYLSYRLPATYAAVSQVFKELKKRSKDLLISSLLDIGAGPGTVLFAAVDAEIPINCATLLERDRGFIALGKKLTEDFEQVETKWVCQDVTKEFNSVQHDLVIASYFLNELLEKDRFSLIDKLWDLTKKFLVIIEPGSKVAYDSLMKLRHHLLLKGAHLLAPCPHSDQCLLAKDDWCHFSARLERASFHRKTKGATLNYEDEKFSYLIFSKTQFQSCHSRVLRRPLKGEGCVKLQLCSLTKIEQKIATKKNKIEYAYSKKIECGDEYFFDY